MKKFETVELGCDERGVYRLCLSRSAKHNAMNAQMIADLSEATTIIREDPATRVCILEASGKTFCAGGDLGWMQAQFQQNREQKMSGAMGLAQMLTELDELPCPLIGKIQGSAYGGGIGLMAVCDMVVAVKNASFSLTETRLGLIPATIGPFVIRRIGEAWARQYFFSGKKFDAKTARQMNLVSHIADADSLDRAIDGEIDAALSCLPGAVRDAKALARVLARNPASQTKELTASKLADRWETDEAKTAIEEFFQNRK